MRISKKQATAFAMHIKDCISEYCKEHNSEYIEFLKSISGTDAQAEKELTKLLSAA